MEHSKILFAHFCTVFSWMFAMISPSVIPIVLSSLASFMGIINYYYSIKKNRRK